jgi:hypothetical protein
MAANQIGWLPKRASIPFMLSSLKVPLMHVISLTESVQTVFVGTSTLARTLMVCAANADILASIADEILRQTSTFIPRNGLNMVAGVNTDATLDLQH